MIPPSKLPDWTSEHASLLRTFLESDVGKIALAHVTETCPALLDGADVNKTLVRSGEVKGFQLALSTLLNLVHEQPAVEITSETYPNLDDESKWNDGNSKT